jgi:dihydrodipicolinate reductase
MDIAILGDGGLGRAVAAAGAERDDTVRLLGRPASGRHDPTTLTGVDVLVEASRADAVVGNLGPPGCGLRAVVLATTGWTDRPASTRFSAARRGAVAASNFSLGVVLFGRLVDAVCVRPLARSTRTRRVASPG